MLLVVDANVLLSALIRPEGLTRKLFADLRLQLKAPAHLLAEFTLHAAEARGKSGLTTAEFTAAAQTIWSRIETVPDEDAAPFLKPASTLIKDGKDWLYLASALACNAEIWSNDRHFKAQGRVRTWTTQELAKQLGY